MQERENILRIFRETKEAMSKGNTSKIKSLSNQTTNTASLTQDPDNIAAAVVVYALSKIIEREDYKKIAGWKNFYKTYLSSINKIIDAIKRKDDKTYDRYISLIRSAINELSGRLKNNIQEVFREASINKASRIYNHGISMEKTAKLLGITQYELASYIGEGEHSNILQGRLTDVKSRIKLAMDFFQ